MDLSLLEKINGLKEQGRSADEIRQELHVEGVAPDNVEAALVEVGMTQNQQPQQSEPATTAPVQHHEKIIQPTPGFDPNAK